MESIVNRAVVNFLDRHNVLFSKQYGFRRRLGTADILTLLHHQWSKTAGSGGSSHVVAVDIAGAFDEVSHAGVLHKASAYGLKGQLLTWLSNYLSARHLRAVVSGYESHVYPISSGVPQGSILGPTLFILYVNDCDSVLRGTEST